jgi:tetratricopeptide (TPR) repeat protein
MYSVAVSVAVALFVGLLAGLRYGIGAAIITGLFAGVLTAFLLFRHFLGKLQAVSSTAFKQVEAQKIDLAIKTLKEGFQYNRWMIRMLGEHQINGHIGTLHYVRKEFDAAFPYLRDSFIKNYMAQLMLAACYYRRKEFDKMEETLEKAAKSNDKVPLVWGVYAWLEAEIDKEDKALAVLGRGVQSNAEDEALKSNLLNLQNKKKMKMGKFGDVWYQLHLEMPPQRMIQQFQAQQKFSAFRRR